MISNCLFYALGKCWREGGYLVIRKSRFGWFPHFLWSPDLKEFWEFTPREPNHNRLLPPVFFHGVVRSGAE